MTNCQVKIFRVHQDGELEPLQSTFIEDFGGTCPDVGDTIAIWGLYDTYRFHVVAGRHFIERPGDSGWAVIVRSVETTEELKKVTDRWIEDTNFWGQIEEAERLAELERVNETIRKLKNQKTTAPVRRKAKRAPTKKTSQTPDK